jgi:hypothetical protein
MGSDAERDLERVTQLIAELDSEEFLLTGLDPSPAAPEVELALAGLRERRAQLEAELEEVWARHCNQC